MTPTGSRSNSRLVGVGASLTLGVVGALVLTTSTGRLMQKSHPVGQTQSGASHEQGGHPAMISDTTWTATLADVGMAVLPVSDDLSTLDLRLVGTFFVYDMYGTNRACNAVLSNAKGSDQAIVAEGGRFGSYVVVKILKDSANVQSVADGSVHTVAIASVDAQSSVGVMGQTGVGGNVSATAQGRLNFGGQIATNSWLLNRDSLLAYYQELRDNPDRMLKVFDTMAPLRDADGKITGYTVNIVGEKPFFDAVGLDQGDVVRKVNSKPMTNRRAAEHLITDFVKDEANAFVLEVERNGSIQRLTYQVR